MHWVLGPCASYSTRGEASGVDLGAWLPRVHETLICVLVVSSSIATVWCILWYDVTFYGSWDILTYWLRDMSPCRWPWCTDGYCSCWTSHSNIETWCQRFDRTLLRFLRSDLRKVSTWGRLVQSTLSSSFYVHVSRVVCDKYVRALDTYSTVQIFSIASEVQQLQ